MPRPNAKNKISKSEKVVIQKNEIQTISLTVMTALCFSGPEKNNIVIGLQLMRFCAF